jgi:hypothetical protein
VRQSTGNYSGALELIAGIMLMSAILPFVIRPPKAQTADSMDAAVNQPKGTQNTTQSAPSIDVKS